MKTTTTLKKIASITGLALGAFALSAFASSAWVAPLTPPPNPNVDAPLNVGTSPQSKNAGLGVGQATMRAGTQKLDVFGTALIDNIVTGTVQIVNGAQDGYVLKSTSQGVVHGIGVWTDPATLGGGSGVTISSIYTATRPGNGPALVTTTISTSDPSAWSACFLTSVSPASSGNSIDKCTVRKGSIVYPQGWFLDASGAANDPVSCSAQCIKVN